MKRDSSLDRYANNPLHKYKKLFYSNIHYGYCSNSFYEGLSGEIYIGFESVYYYFNITENKASLLCKHGFLDVYDGGLTSLVTLNSFDKLYKIVSKFKKFPTIQELKSSLKTRLIK